MKPANYEHAASVARERARDFVTTSVLCPFEDGDSPIAALTEHSDHVAEALGTDGDSLETAMQSIPSDEVRDQVDTAARNVRVTYLWAGYLFGLEVGRQLASGGAR